MQRLLHEPIDRLLISQAAELQEIGFCHPEGLLEDRLEVRREAVGGVVVREMNQ